MNAIYTKPTLVDPLASLRVRHTRIGQMMADVSCSLNPKGPMLAVVGPTGVGKSALGHFLVDDAVRKNAREMAEDPSFVPAIRVEAKSSGEDGFSWRMFYLQILTALGEDPDMPHQAYGVDITGRLILPRRGRRNNLLDLRNAVENALIARKVDFVVVDEAAHITNRTKGENLLAQVNTLKSLSNTCGIQLILLGSYDLYDLVSLSGQLARRIQVLHFSRYREDVPEDVLAYQASLKMFQDTRTDLWGNSLMDYADALQENSVGCVGTTRDVLVNAEMIAKARGKWSPDILIAAALTVAQRETILKEVLNGENLIVPGIARTLDFHAGKVGAAG